MTSQSVYDVGNEEALTVLAGMSAQKKRLGVVITPIKISGERGGWVHLKYDSRQFWAFYPPLTVSSMAMKLAAMGFRNLSVQEPDYDEH